MDDELLTEAAETDELKRLTKHRDRLEHEQDRLRQARYGDAVPLPALKREQERVLGELDSLNRRIDDPMATTPTPVPISTMR